MKNIDKEFDKMKKEIDNLQVPDELESMLKISLDKVPSKKKKFNYKSIIAAAALAIFFIGYNADAISYYGKKLIGYENVMNFTLNQLNELDKGQTINKSYSFEDGTVVTLDGVMLDDNNLVTFYNIYQEEGFNGDYAEHITATLESRGSNYSGGGQGQLSDDGRSVKWVTSYNSPKFFEKNIKLSLYNDNLQERGEIEFKLDRSKAMGKNLKLSIDKNIKVANRTININNLIASPITTVIDGTFQDIFELGKDVLSGERIYYNDIELELLADGKNINIQSGGTSTNLKGYYFHSSFDAIPKDTKEIQLILKSLTITEDIDEKLDLNGDLFPKTINILDRDIAINKVYEKDGNTYVNITSEEDVIIPSLFLNIDGKDIRNERTLDETFDKIVEKDGAKHLLKTRTVEFIGTGEKLELKIKKISYNKKFNLSLYNNKIK